MESATVSYVILGILLGIMGVPGIVLLMFSDLDGHPLRLFIGILLCIGAGAVLARFLVAVLTLKAGSPVFPGGNGPVSPRYSMAEAKLLRGEYREAFEKYRAITGEFSQEVTAWCKMIEICLDHFHDTRLAQETLDTALRLVTSEKKRELLQRTFDERAEELAELSENLKKQLRQSNV